MTAASLSRIKSKITTVLQQSANVSPSRVRTLLPVKSLQGKLYEAHVLASICSNLAAKEGCSLSLVGGNKLVLKQKGSPIDRSYPYFEIKRGKVLIGELFTDIYFNTLSHFIKGSPNPPTHGDFHELDIALLKPGLKGYPSHAEVLLAVECKNTAIKKSIIRELLGFRRELSFLAQGHIPTGFRSWPANRIKANPASVHMLYCSDRRINRYQTNCDQFGIILEHHKM